MADSENDGTSLQCENSYNKLSSEKDIRRWRIAEEIFKNPLEGLEIRVKGNTTSFNEVDVLSTTFDVKRYLYPIPYNEVVKNDNMIQNPKW